MNTHAFHALRRSAKRETGAAAIEFAFLVPILFVFLMFPIFYARCLWHYTVAQKAAQDAARYLSTVSRMEMMRPDLAAEARQLAIEIAEREIAELAPGSTIIGPQAFCDLDLCGELDDGVLPTTVRVRISFTMTDPYGLVDFGWFGLRITGNHTVRYVGN